MAYRESAKLRIQVAIKWLSNQGDSAWFGNSGDFDSSSLKKQGSTVLKYDMINCLHARA